MSEKLNLAIVVGSTRQGRFGPTVGRWFAWQAEQHDDMNVDVIDLADAKLPADLTDDPPPEVVAVTPRLEAADAFVIITPEYNHSYPASLKTFIDWHFTEWQAKPIGFVSYGGMGGGLRSVEHLRQVFAELHATTVRDVVSFHSYWDHFGDDGRPKDLEGANGAAKGMLDQIAWWGHALKRARTAAPYKV